MLPRTLTSVQSRLLAYAFTICILSTIWSARTLATASELPVVLDTDDLHQPAQYASPVLAPAHDGAGEMSGYGGYSPDFGLFDRSIIGRQDAQLNELKNNEKKEMDINPGNTVYFVLKKGQSRLVRAEGPEPVALGPRDIGNESQDTDAGALDEHLESRQAGNRIWITANTCRQPTPNVNDTRTSRNNPQLVMYVSTQNQKPGPDSTQNLLTDPTGVLFDGGFAKFNASVNSDVYIGIAAPMLDKDWVGSWHFEVAASTDGAYHSYNENNPFLFMVDTDSESALFITYNLSDSNLKEATDQWKETNPFRMYAFPAGAASPVKGVEYSYCAIKELFTNNTINVTTTITNKFGGGIPRSQFHVHGLDNGKVYNGFLVVEGQNKTMRLPGFGEVRGGGKVFQQFNWTTKVEDSCQVLSDLDFCDSVAYAVPSSPKFKFDDDALKKIYDDQAKSYYQNFSRSLAQIACDTTSEAQYSLARTCKDCDRDYKNWLCSVLIPRCEDWSANDTWLQPRNMNAAFANGTTLNISEILHERFAFNQSRNPLIDDVIKPGPYREMLPCDDLCVDIVRSCPAKLGFQCPNSPTKELSYGKRDPSQVELWCSFPGAVVKLNVQGAAGTLAAHGQMVVLIALLVAAVSLL